MLRFIYLMHVTIYDMQNIVFYVYLYIYTICNRYCKYRLYVPSIMGRKTVGWRAPVGLSECGPPAILG